MSGGPKRRKTKNAAARSILSRLWDFLTSKGAPLHFPPRLRDISRRDREAKRLRKSWTAFLIAALTVAALLRGQTTAPAPAPQPAARPVSAAAELKGRTVEDIRIVGNTTVSNAVILNVIRTRAGEPFDPATVEEDYQRVYSLKKFSNVEAKVEPTAAGVIVVFIVSEQKQITDIAFRGNLAIDTLTLQGIVDLQVGQAIDMFRISSARAAVESLYREKNYPYAHVEVDADYLAQTGELVFNIVEGANVKVRKVAFVGSKSFSNGRLKDQIRTRSWIWIFRPGTLDLDLIEDDVAALRRYYESKGFFDVRVGRKLIVSPDQTEVQVNFLVEEGVRYRVSKVTFKGNSSVSEVKLREEMRMLEGRAYDNDVVLRDVREIVRAYSRFGFIYQPMSQSPDYLRIEPKTVFSREAGTVELVYQISEGKPFRTGRVLIKGNSKTQDKVVLREMRVTPGQKYNSAEIADAQDRLRGTPYFSSVTITPIGDDPNIRDVLVEVQELRTATFSVGAGVNSNGGVGGNITYEQRNFDIGNPPNSWDEIFSERAFVGAGQSLRISLEPGTRQTNASIRFYEPWLFDQPYSFGAEAYYRNRVREHYDETRAGGRLTFGKRFSNVYSATIGLRGEDVNIHSIDDFGDVTPTGESIRAPEINEAKGHHTVTSTTLTLRRDTTNRGLLPSRGTTSTLAWESYGALGGEFMFQKFTGSFDYYHELYEDLLDRRVTFAFHTDAGYITGDSPFFERFYGGGIGSIRGFRFRGVSPRDGAADDPIGGEFSLTSSAEISFPLASDNIRGVVFTDVGTVEDSATIGTIRSSVGAGIRLTLPFLGQVPVAIDFAYPITKSSEDDTQWISFSLGITQ